MRWSSPMPISITADICLRWPAKASPARYLPRVTRLNWPRSYSAIAPNCCGGSRACQFLRLVQHHPALPLYTEDDVDHAVRLITPVDPGQETVIAPHTMLTLHHAGHILGSAWARLESTGGRRSCTLACSGDLGRPRTGCSVPQTPSPGPMCCSWNQRTGTASTPTNRPGRVCRHHHPDPQAGRPSNHPRIRRGPDRGHLAHAPRTTPGPPDPAVTGAHRQPDGAFSARRLPEAIASGSSELRPDIIVG